MIVGYLDTSGRNISPDEQRSIISQYIAEGSSSVSVFLSDKNIQNIINSVNPEGATVLISNVACLGNKLSLVVESLETLTEKGFTLVSIKENLKFDKSEETKLMLQGIRLSIDIRNSMVSTITTNALSNRKLDGYAVGRQTGSKNKTHLCDAKYAQIKTNMAKGMSNVKVAKSIGVSIATLYNFLKEHPELRDAKKERK